MYTREDDRVDRRLLFLVVVFFSFHETTKRFRNISGHVNEIDQ